MGTHLAGQKGCRAPPAWAQPRREPSALEEAGRLPPWKERQFPAQDRAGRTRECSNRPPQPSLPVPGDSHLRAEPREEAGLVVLIAERRKETYSLESQSLQIPSHRQQDGGTRSKATLTHEAWSPRFPAGSRWVFFCGNPRQLPFWGPHVAPAQPCVHPPRTGRTRDSDSGASC